MMIVDILLWVARYSGGICNVSHMCVSHDNGVDAVIIKIISNTKSPNAICFRARAFMSWFSSFKYLC